MDVFRQREKGWTGRVVTVHSPLRILSEKERCSSSRTEWSREVRDRRGLNGSDIVHPAIPGDTGHGPPNTGDLHVEHELDYGKPDVPRELTEG